MGSAELYAYAKELQVSHQLLKKTAELGRLPVVNFAAGGLGKSRVYFFKDSCIHRVPLKDQICLKEIYITRFDQNILWPSKLWSQRLWSEILIVEILITETRNFDPKYFDHRDYDQKFWS